MILKIEFSNNGIEYYIDDIKVNKNQYFKFFNKCINNKYIDNEYAELAYNLGYYDGQIDLSNSYNTTISNNTKTINSLKLKALKEFKDYR